MNAYHDLYTLIFLISLVLPLYQQKTPFLFSQKESSELGNQKVIMRCMFVRNSEQVKHWERTYKNILADYLLRLKKFKDYDVLMKLLQDYHENKLLAFAYLLYKMLYGDGIASRMFSELTHANKIHDNENELMNVAVDAFKITGGVSTSHFALYQAYLYLKEKPFQEGEECKGAKSLSSEDEFSLENTFSLLNMPAGWNDIQYYKYSRAPTILPEVKAPWHYFPIIENYVKSNKICGKIPSIVEKTNIPPKKENLFVPLEECGIQIVGPQTHENYILEQILITISGKVSRTEIWVPQNNQIPFYNCASFSVGINHYLGNQYWTPDGGREDITTVSELKLFLKQIALAAKYAENRNNNFSLRGNDHHFQEFLDEIIHDKVPTRILPLLMNDINYLDNKIGSLGNLPSEEIIKNACGGSLDNAVVFYSHRGISSHMSIFNSELNTWESKLCESYLLVHRFDDLNSPESFGQPRFFFCPSMTEGFSVKDNEHF